MGEIKNLIPEKEYRFYITYVNIPIKSKFVLGTNVMGNSIEDAITDFRKEYKNCRILAILSYENEKSNTNGEQGEQ